MRSRVKTNWRTRALLAVALVVSGIIAYREVQAREGTRPERARAAPAAPAQRGVIEVELVP